MPLLISWLLYQEIYVTSNAPYGIGTGIRTSTVRCPSWYVLSNFFLPIIVFRLATSLRYMFDEPQLQKITGTVIGQVTVPVMTS